MRKIFTLNLIAFFLVLPFCSAAHYIVGIVENAKDGTEANGHTILLWNPAVGIQDNLSDIVGPSGNSQTDDIYMIDCEMLVEGCNINETLSLKVINNGDNYISGETSVNVSGEGYDLVNNITLNSPPNITSINIDDDLINPANEIDLIPADTKEVTCTGVAMDYEGEGVNNWSYRKIL